MPLGTIWRDPKIVTDKQAVAIRDVLRFAIQKALSVKLDEVEVRVRDIGPLDVGYMPIGIELDTGTGTDNWRIPQKRKVACEVAERIHGARVIPQEWIGPDKSYVWLRIVESCFVPIGFPNHAR